MMTKNLGWLATPLLTLIAPAAHAEWALNMPKGITDVSRSVYGLHMLTFWICVWIAVFVFGWMIYSIVVFRHSKGAVPDTKLVHNTKAEIIWTTIPVLILIGMAVPATAHADRDRDASNSQLTIRVTGYQWKWGYEYLDSGVSLLSTPGSRQQRGPPAGLRASIRTPCRTTCSTSITRWWCRPGRRCAC